MKKLRKKSKLTFKDLASYLLFIRVFWNGKLVYDDTAEVGSELADFTKLILKYGSKIVYSMNVDVVEYHHCVLDVKGEIV